MYIMVWPGALWLGTDENEFVRCNKGRANGEHSSPDIYLATSRNMIITNYMMRVIYS